MTYSVCIQRMKAYRNMVNVISVAYAAAAARRSGVAWPISVSVAVTYGGLVSRRGSSVRRGVAIVAVTWRDVFSV